MEERPGPWTQPIPRVAVDGQWLMEWIPQPMGEPEHASTLRFLCMYKILLIKILIWF